MHLQHGTAGPQKQVTQGHLHRKGHVGALSRSASLLLPGWGHHHHQNFHFNHGVPRDTRPHAFSADVLKTAMAGDRGSIVQDLVSSEVGKTGGSSEDGGAGGEGSRKKDHRMWMAKEEGKQMHRELHSLNIAIGVNIIICLAKVWVHLISGSSAMLAEALHSVADILNQVLLRVGVLKAKRAPTPQHPYGYLRDRFVWSLISAVGIFFLGAGASVIHGLHTLMEVRVLGGEMWSYAVLGLSAVLEGYSLLVASRYVMAGAAAQRMTFLQYVKSGLDPTTVAVMLEDGGAVAGLLIAGICTGLTHYTGNAMWDAAGSIAVGGLLGVIAMFLVQKNRDLLLGRSMGRADTDIILEHLKKDPVVAFVTDTKTEEIGPGIFRFKAEVAWNGDKLVERYLERCGRGRLEAALRHALSPVSHPALMDGVLKSYGRDIINAVGAEVDRIEGEIQAINPGCRYVDLETDRGRFSADPVLRDAFASLMGPQANGSSDPGSRGGGPGEGGASGSRGCEGRATSVAGESVSGSNSSAFAAGGGLGIAYGLTQQQQHESSEGVVSGEQQHSGPQDGSFSSGSRGSEDASSGGGGKWAAEETQPLDFLSYSNPSFVWPGSSSCKASLSSRGGHAARNQGAEPEGSGTHGQELGYVDDFNVGGGDGGWGSSSEQGGLKEVYLENGEVGSSLDGSSFSDGSVSSSAESVSAFVADYPCSLCDIPLEDLGLEGQLLQQEQCLGYSSSNNQQDSRKPSQGSLIESKNLKSYKSYKIGQGVHGPGEPDKGDPVGG